MLLVAKDVILIKKKFAAVLLMEFFASFGPSTEENFQVFLV